MKNNIELSAVEDHNGILTIRGGGARRDWNGIHYKQGMSSKNVGTTKLSANVAIIPPGGVAYANIYINPGVPHEVFNMSDTEPVVAFVARSSADEWDNIIPYDRSKTG